MHTINKKTKRRVLELILDSIEQGNIHIILPYIDISSCLEQCLEETEECEHEDIEEGDALCSCDKCNSFVKCTPMTGTHDSMCEHCKPDRQIISKCCNAGVDFRGGGYDGEDILPVVEYCKECEKKCKFEVIDTPKPTKECEQFYCADCGNIIPNAIEATVYSEDVENVKEIGLSIRKCKCSTPNSIKLEQLSEKLHEWYLEGTQKLDPENYNPNAQKQYSELNEEQKEIDRYIAGKVLAKLDKQRTALEKISEFEVFVGESKIYHMHVIATKALDE